MDPNNLLMIALYPVLFYGTSSYLFCVQLKECGQITGRLWGKMADRTLKQKMNGEWL
jgi:hypothetical protein|tara:strand:- start:1059 stop:1229 length:171 start_codon:yes stop_codon:yes gene_type:complete